MPCGVKPLFLLLTSENLPLGIYLFTNEELSSIVNSSKAIIE